MPGAPELYVDGFCGRIYKSVLRKQDTDHSPEKLKNTGCAALYIRTVVATFSSMLTENLDEGALFLIEHKEAMPYAAGKFLSFLLSKAYQGRSEGERANGFQPYLRFDPTLPPFTSTKPEKGPNILAVYTDCTKV